MSDQFDHNGDEMSGSKSLALVLAMPKAPELVANGEIAQH